MVYIRGFDGLRAISVILVVLTHMGAYAALAESPLLPLIHGGVGVTIFFVLSGFLITTLLTGEFQKYNQVNIKHFFARRALRIFPLYFLFLMLVTILQLSGDNLTSNQSLIYGYLYLYNFIPKDIYSTILGHTWTLAVEEHFYLLWPIAFLFLSKKNSGLITLCLALISICFVIDYFIHYTAPSPDYFFYRWTIPAASSILLGCLGALLVAKQHRLLLPLFQNNFAYITLSIAILFYSNSLFSYAFLDNIISSHIQKIGILLIIIWIYYNQHVAITKILESIPLRVIGKMSYGVYIWQGFYFSTGPWRAPDQHWPPEPQTGLIYLIITVPISYFFFEKYFLRWKKAFSR